jgi:hypothetical protein
MGTLKNKMRGNESKAVKAIVAKEKPLASAQDLNDFIMNVTGQALPTGSGVGRIIKAAKIDLSRTIGDICPLTKRPCDQSVFIETRHPTLAGVHITPLRLIQDKTLRGVLIENETPEDDAKAVDLITHTIRNGRLGIKKGITALNCIKHCAGPAKKILENDPKGREALLRMSINEIIKK